MVTEEAGPFQVFDEDRMAVAKDRLSVQRLQRGADHMSDEIVTRASRLARRDRVNGYAQMLRDVLGERK